MFFKEKWKEMGIFGLEERNPPSPDLLAPITPTVFGPLYEAKPAFHNKDRVGSKCPR